MLRNIGIINSTTQSHLVGSFYEIYIMMHGSMTHQVYAYVLLMIEQCFVRKGKRAEKRVSSEPRHLRSTVRAFTSKKSTVFRKHVSLRGKQYLEIFQTRKLSGFPSHIPVYRFSLLRKRYLSCKHQNVPLPFKISSKKKKFF